VKTPVVKKKESSDLIVKKINKITSDD